MLRNGEGTRPATNEAFGVVRVRGCQDLGTPLCDLVRHAVVDHRRGEQADATVTMLIVVPGEELPAEGACLLDGIEVGREVRTVLQLTFRT